MDNQELEPTRNCLSEIEDYTRELAADLLRHVCHLESVVDSMLGETIEEVQAQREPEDHQPCSVERIMENLRLCRRAFEILLRQANRLEGEEK